MTDASKRRLAAVVALLISGGALAFLAFSNVEKNLVYYWDPEQLLAQGNRSIGATVRLGGVVQKGSVHWDPNALKLSFNIGMGPQGKRFVPVDSTGTPPQMFQEARGVVVEGSYDGRVFRAERVMVKHSNEYRAKKEGEYPQEIYKTLVAE